jgi:hypothetical protein
MPASKTKPKTKPAPRASGARKPANKSTTAVAKTKSPAKPDAASGSASQHIDQRIRELGDWRGETLARMRKLILEVDPDITEEWKWSNPAWSRAGIICTGESYKKIVKLTFAKGAALEDPKGLFNSSLGGNTRRAIDIKEGETVDATAFKALVRSAIAVSGGVPPTKKTPAAKTTKSGTLKKGENGVVLLAGGNPQIAKGDGDTPVQAYIAAIPDDWKRDITKRFDALVEKSVPNVKKAVKWNSPFYGVEGMGWIVNVHCFTKYVKITFFSGGQLKPLPPESFKDPKARCINIKENDTLDEKQMADWLKQAASIPGWMA